MEFKSLTKAAFPIARTILLSKCVKQYHSVPQLLLFTTTITNHSLPQLLTIHYHNYQPFTTTIANHSIPQLPAIHYHNYQPFTTTITNVLELDLQGVEKIPVTCLCCREPRCVDCWGTSHTSSLSLKASLHSHTTIHVLYTLPSHNYSPLSPDRSTLADPEETTAEHIRISFITLAEAGPSSSALFNSPVV